MSAAAWQVWLVGIIVGLPTDGPGRAYFTPGYPRTGQLAGTIEIRGSVILRKGWQVLGKTVKMHVFINGGSVCEFEAPIQNNVWHVTVTGLVSGQTYVTDVFVQVTDGKTTETLCAIGLDPQAK